VLRFSRQFLLGFIGWLVCTNLLWAQRVQFPSVVPPTTAPPFQGAPVTPAPAITPMFDPYTNPTLGTPPADIPYNVTPNFPTGIQPTTAQPILPQAIPPVTPGVTEQSGSLFPNGLPWQNSSSTYQYGNSDGSVAKLQRLMQQISWEQTWLYDNGSPDALGINRTELDVTFGVPIFSNPDTPLLITPGFAFNWLSGPRLPGYDLPPRVYDAYLDTAWHPQISQFFSADLGLRTGVYSDFNEVNSDSFRIMGRGLGVMSLTPQMDFLLGAWYLDRNDIKILPAGGVHWRPGGLWDFYAVFPNPKIRRRWATMGTAQFWMYFSGEYGASGGRWTVDRDGVPDDIDINDIRAIWGVEWETQTQARGHFEVGYVFDRQIYYAESGMGTLDVDDTIMLRAGIEF
jgi:hypothetical protein